jgi:hypothetical protein
MDWESLQMLNLLPFLNHSNQDIKNVVLLAKQLLSFHVMIWRLLTQLHAMIMKYTVSDLMIESLYQFKVKEKSTFLIKDVETSFNLEQAKIGMIYKEDLRMM